MRTKTRQTVKQGQLPVRAVPKRIPFIVARLLKEKVKPKDLSLLRRNIFVTIA